MNKWLEIIVGLFLVVGSISLAWYSKQWFGALWDFKSAAWIVLKGGIFWLVFLIGILFVLIGISDLKS